MARCHAQRMFVRRDLVLDLSFEAGRARLVNRLREGGIAGASRAAYEAGITVIRVGPLAKLPAAGKLVRVSFLEPAYRDGWLQVGLRWEATGITGDLFPVLDGDFTLSPAGDDAARLVLAGAYRPPLGRLGDKLDAIVLNKVANATFSALLRSVADTLARPGQAPEAAAAPGPGTVLSRPASEPSAT
jgi:hypothetical protein